MTRTEREELVKKLEAALFVWLALMLYGLIGLVKSRYDRPCYVDTITEVLRCP